MIIKELFSSEYLFNPTPSFETKMYLPLIVLFGAMLILSILLKLMGRKIPKQANSFFTPFLTGSVLGFVHLFSRYEGLSWLASRFFLLLIFSGIFLWVLILLILVLKSLPKELKRQTVEERYKKYLPKSKTK